MRYVFLLGLLSCTGVDTDPEGSEPPVFPELEWRHYRMPEPGEPAPCVDTENASAVVSEVRFAQTHEMTPEWPFFFLIADRPAKVRTVIQGTGPTPNVRVQVHHDNVLLGERCMSGPSELSPEGALFDTILPSHWMRAGAEFTVIAGEDSVAYTDLDLRYAPELSLVMLEMDVANYNDGKEDKEPPVDFLEEVTSAMPVAAGHFGVIPARFPIPEILVGPAAYSPGELPILMSERLCQWDEAPDTHPCWTSDLVHDGDVNAAALRYVEAFQWANGDAYSRIYFGNTEHLFPGGWGGGRTFVSGDYHGVTIHELGHALSLPHWGDAFEQPEPDEWAYVYPWGGENFDGGGRGPTDGYIQHLDEFVDTSCQDPDSGNNGLERSDGMQRNIYCDEWRSGGRGPWDGLSDFSAFAIFRFLTGAERLTGSVVDPVWGSIDYAFPERGGYPVVSWDEDGPTWEWEGPGEEPEGFSYDFQRPQEWDVPVFTIYGTHMIGHPEFNRIFDPIAHQGNLPALIDPTDPDTFAELAMGYESRWGWSFYWHKDITVRVTYEDGHKKTFLYPYPTAGRDVENASGPWRNDITYFAINVPGRDHIAHVELFERPFRTGYPDEDDAGNINFPDHGITAENFMAGASLVAEWGAPLD